jgi:hypothetical protein
MDRSNNESIYFDSRNALPSEADFRVATRRPFDPEGKITGIFVMSSPGD